MLPLASDTWTFWGLDATTWKTILLGAGVGGLAGFIGSLFANKLYDYLLRPVFTIRVDPRNPSPVNPSVGPDAFFHVLIGLQPRSVPLLGTRRIPRGVRAYVSFFNPSRDHIYLQSEPARWAGWPTPTFLVPVAMAPGKTTLEERTDTGEIARQRTFDFELPDQQEQVDVVLKIENDPAVYFWNNESYRHGARYVRHQLGLGNYHVEVAVRHEGRTERRWFTLSNGGPSWRDVDLGEIPR